MNEKYIERKHQTDEFEIRHESFLEKLRYIPTDKKEERWDFFNGYDQRESFIIELMEVYRPGTYSKIKDRLEKVATDRLKEDSNVACWGNKEIDTAAFMEIIKEAIETYVGRSKGGEDYGFVACAGTLYRQKASKVAAENALRKKGITDQEVFSRKSLPNVLKLARAAERVWAENFEKIPKEEALKQAVEEASYHCTKKEMELVRALFFSDSVVVSMDAPLEAGDKDTGNTFGEQQEDKRDCFEAVFGQVTENAFLEVFCQEIEERWKIITSAKGLREQELIKAFLTQGILKELKLNEDGKPYLKEPAGNEAFYCNLKPKGDFLYHRLFLKKYLRRAFVETPEDFYNVYARLLRKDFSFSDKILAEAIGKDKTAVSKGKKRYFNLMKAICDCCIVD